MIVFLHDLYAKTRPAGLKSLDLKQSMACDGLRFHLRRAAQPFPARGRPHREQVRLEKDCESFANEH